MKAKRKNITPEEIAEAITRKQNYELEQFNRQVDELEERIRRKLMQGKFRIASDGTIKMILTGLYSYELREAVQSRFQAPFEMLNFVFEIFFFFTITFRMVAQDKADEERVPPPPSPVSAGVMQK